MINSITTHAHRRASQRGLRPNMMNLLENYGQIAYLHNGVKVVYLDRRTIREIEGEFGGVVANKLGKKANAYAVVSKSGNCITVGIRYKRIKN